MSNHRNQLTKIMTRSQRMVEMGIAIAHAESESNCEKKKKCDDSNSIYLEKQDDELTELSSLFSQDSRDEYFPSSESSSSGSNPDEQFETANPKICEIETVSSGGSNLLQNRDTELISDENFPSLESSLSGSNPDEQFETANPKQCETEPVSSGGSNLLQNRDTELISAAVPSRPTAAPVERNETESTVSSKKVSNRKQDKKYSCLFCKKLISKLPRHLKSAHINEELVKEWLSVPNGNESVKKLSEIRNKGNYLHNIKVLTSEGNASVLITKKTQPKVLGSVDTKKYLPCEKCLGFFSKKYLYRHNKICKGKGSPSSKHNRNLQARSLMLLPTSVQVDKSLADNVLSKMMNDSVYEAIRQDALIISYGKKMYKKHGHEKHLHQFVAQKMREIGRFLISAKEVNENITCLKDILDKKHYKTCVEAVFRVAQFNNNSSTFGIPSLALKTGNALKKCANILKGLHMNNDNDVGLKTVDQFMSVFSMNWTEDVSIHALRTLHEKKWNAPKLLPLAEDMKKFYKYMKQKSSELKTELIETPNKTVWFELAKVTLAHIVTFNRRRVGETQRLTIETYLKKQNASMDDEVKKSLSDMEVKLAESLQRIVTRGKKGRGVAILITADMRNSLDILMQFRSIASIDPDNPFIFPARDSKESLRGCDVMRYIAGKAGLQKPNLVTSTRLRKHVGTMAQLLNLTKNELDLLAGFMGHDIRIHREFYRLSSDTLEMAKISKVLVAMEQGNIEKFAGQSLNEIVIDNDEMAEEDPPSEDDDVQQSQEEEVGLPNENEENEETVQKLTKKKIQRKKPQVLKKPTKKMPWSNEEKSAVFSFFSNEINLGIVPQKAKCVACISKYPILSNRSWSQIKFSVYNKITSKK